ncbi:OLC1v1003391C1 [Oldenlandia corymbosa var. corymbosa]|uniref:OLC1v1003391C1 n=1 Tax=Oldenlandia corymbosa var. corymbosa TaxID=529605 RepID=A0AAV1DCR0_OLDCO|nr:OLC1v1003391C1 [Oldenlandia corymbosa var. corymbosa]
MAIRLPRIIQAKQLLKRSSSFGSNYLQATPSASVDVPKGYCAVYVGESDEKKRYIIPIAYLNQPSFQELLSQAEDEFGYAHPMGGLTIPCREQMFIDLASRLSRKVF